MELNITMRYCMVKAQKEAAGGEIYAEHIFLAFLSLYDKSIKDIARRTEQEEAVRIDLEYLKSAFSKEEINAKPTYERLREGLAGKFKDAPQPDSDYMGVLARAEKSAGDAGRAEITVADFIYEAFSPLVKYCIVEVGAAPYSPEQTVLDAGATMFDVGAEPPPPQPQYKPTPPPPQPQYNPPVPPPVKPVTPPVVYIDPLAGQKDAKVFKPVLKTKIAGIKFKGGPALALSKYFILVIIIFTAIWFLFNTYSDRLPSSEEQLRNLTFYILLTGAVHIVQGVISLIGRRFKAFEVFSITCLYLLFVYILTMIIANAAGRDEPQIFVKLAAAIYGFFLLAMQITNLAPAPGQQNLPSLSTAMLKVRGTPGAIFFSYALRSLLVPGLVAVVIWVGNLNINHIFHAIFSIYCFLWACETVRVMIQCWGFYYTSRYQKGKRYQEFVSAEYNILFLPLLGLFLMWYFGCFPMATWVIVVYSIYGFIWFITTIGLAAAVRKV